MGNLWLKFRVWTKVIVFLAVVLYGLTFIYQNGSRKVTVWLWYKTEPNNSVLVLVLCSFLLGAITVVLIRTTTKTIRQIRELRGRSRAQKAERELAHMRVKASMLRERADGSVASTATDIDDGGTT